MNTERDDDDIDLRVARMRMHMFNDAVKHSCERHRLKGDDAERYQSNIGIMAGRIFGLIERQLGAVGTYSFDSMTLNWLVLDVMDHSADIVSSARGTEMLHAQRETTSNMLAALAAGGKVGAETPAVGKALFDVFGGRVRSDLEAREASRGDEAGEF